MPKLTNLLSDRQLKNWMIKGDTVAKSDGDGLTFTLSNAGTASWVLRYRLNGRRKEVTLGNYPDISLSNAREHVHYEQPLTPAKMLLFKSKLHAVER